MGTEAVPGTEVCAGGNERNPEHFGKYLPGDGTAVHNPAIQIPVPDRMHLPGTEAAGWRVLLPLLVKVYAKTELLPEERGSDTPGACGR